MTTIDPIPARLAALKTTCVIRLKPPSEFG